MVGWFVLLFLETCWVQYCKTPVRSFASLLLIKVLKSIHIFPLDSFSFPSWTQYINCSVSCVMVWVFFLATSVFHLICYPSPHTFLSLTLLVLRFVNPSWRCYRWEVCLFPGQFWVWNSSHAWKFVNVVGQNMIVCWITWPLPWTVTSSRIRTEIKRGLMVCKASVSNF